MAFVLPLSCYLYITVLAFIVLRDKPAAVGEAGQTGTAGTYLASPAVVAASAVTGYITGPDGAELDGGAPRRRWPGRCSARSARGHRPGG